MAALAALRLRRRGVSTEPRRAQRVATGRARKVPQSFTNIDGLAVATPGTMSSHRLVALALLGLSSSFGVGCSSVAPNVVVSKPVAAPAAPGPAILASRARAYVWIRSGGVATTKVIDDEGRVLDSLDGIVLATPRGVVRVRSEAVAVPTEPCEAFDDRGDPLPREQWYPPGEGESTKLSLVGPDGTKVLAEVSLDDGANEVKHSAEVIASVGPYLFVRESTYTYACGAHGFSGASAKVYDVARGEEVAVEPGPREAEALRKRAVKALTTDDGFDPGDGQSEVQLTQTLVDWRAGSLAVQYQFTAGTCYACSDGAWSSYTKSVALDAPGLPRALAAHREVPMAVKTFLEKNPGVTLGGFTTS